MPRSRRGTPEIATMGDEIKASVKGFRSHVLIQCRFKQNYRCTQELVRTVGGLIITLISIPLLAATVLLGRLFATFGRKRAQTFLGDNPPVPEKFKFIGSPWLIIRTVISGFGLGHRRLGTWPHHPRPYFARTNSAHHQWSCQA